MATDSFSDGIHPGNQRKINKEIGCGVVFYMSVLVHMIICFIIFGSKNSEIITVDLGKGEITCADGYVRCDVSYPQVTFETQLQCMKADLCTDLKKCATGLPNQGRYLQTASKPKKDDASKDVWEFLERYFYQPLVLFACVFILAAVWLGLLAKFTRTVVWGTFVADFLLLVALFVWFIVEADYVNIPCIILAVFLVLGCIIARKQIQTVCTIIKVAMEGLLNNVRLFLVTFVVQCVWVAFFAMWIAAIIGSHFVKEAGTVVRDNRTYCEIRTTWTTNGILLLYFILHYHVATAFFKNINTMMITVNLGGWYFNEPGYESFWMSALKWALGPQCGGTALCAFIMGFMEYLLSRVSSPFKICLGCLNPLEWPFVCLGLLLKHVAMVFTKFGLIAMTFSGGSFIGTAPKAFKVLKSRLGEAVVGDYIGKRIMSWCTYLLALGVAFAAWAWADSGQDLENLESMPAALIIVLMIVFAWIVSYPLVGLLCVVFIEQIIGGFNIDWNSSEGAQTVRMTLNSIFAAVFMGCCTQFILDFISGVVVTAMDVTLFCYCIENQKQVNRKGFSELYDGIKDTFEKNERSVAPETRVVSSPR